MYNLFFTSTRFTYDLFFPRSNLPKKGHSEPNTLILKLIILQLIPLCEIILDL